MTLTHFNGSDGVTLAADCYRHHDSPAVVLLLHGGGQNRQAWAATAHQLHEAGYTVIAYDARGHGDSAWDPTGHYDLDVLASDLLAVRAQASSDRPVAVVGASLGGMTVLGAHRLAAADLWAAVTLVDITPRMEFDRARRVVSFMAAHPDGFGSLDEAADVIAEYNPHRARPRSLNGLRKVLRPREDNRWIWRWDPAFVTSNFHVLRGDPAAGAEEFNAITDLLVDGARRVQAPTLLVRGVLSDVTSPQSVDEFLQVVPHAQTVDVSGTAHMVAGDDNDAFTAAVADFLDRTIAATS